METLSVYLRLTSCAVAKSLFKRIGLFFDGCLSLLEKKKDEWLKFRKVEIRKLTIFDLVFCKTMEGDAQKG